METEALRQIADPRPLPVVGGHLALDFANTVDDPEGTARFDHVLEFPGLLTWSSDRGSVTAAQAARIRRRVRREPSAAASTLGRAHDLRAVITGTFTAVASGESVPRADWQLVRSAAADALHHADLGEWTDGLALTWPRTDDPDALLWPVATAALDLLRSPELRRVKQCGGCPWLFVDRSRNGSRRWCAMEDCGTHEKIRRYVDRRADRRRAAREERTSP